MRGKSLACRLTERRRVPGISVSRVGWGGRKKIGGNERRVGGKGYIQASPGMGKQLNSES